MTVVTKGHVADWRITARDRLLPSEKVENFIYTLQETVCGCKQPAAALALDNEQKGHNVHFDTRK